MPNTARRSALLGTLLAGLAAAPVAPAQSDNFDDNAIGPQWTAIADNPGGLPTPPIRVVEQNGRLEVFADSPASASLDGLYVSNDSFRLSTAADFEIAVDFTFGGTFPNQAVGDALSLFFGVGRDLPDGTDSAAIGYGVLTTTFGPFTLTGTGPTAAWRIDDVQSTAVPPGPLAANPASGTFRVQYTSLSDVLSLGIDGFATFVPAVSLVRGTWGAESLYVSLGSRGQSHSVDGAGAWFDDFTLVSGVIVPEPAATPLLLALAGPLALALPRRRRA